jgi:hypothetical protein
MAYYEQIKERDLITRLKRLLQNGGYFLRDDGKLQAQHKIAWDQPWHHVRHHPMLDCHTWHRILFDTIVMGLPPQERFVPSRCQDCWKVVVRPRSLKQLFALLNLQKQMDRPSKCGIETRETVHGLYGGYFYNIGLEAGRECYDLVRKAVNDEPLLGPSVTVLLKRACTEYEHAIGPSDKWRISRRQLEIEGLLDTILAKDDTDRRQSDHNLQYIHRKWIEWAWAAGDPTYAEFTDGPIYPPYVTYHDNELYPDGYSKNEWRQTSGKNIL